MLQQQMEAQDCRHHEQMERLTEDQKGQERQHEEEMTAMMKAQGQPHTKESTNKAIAAAVTRVSTPNFSPFDSTWELGMDYWSIFCTFTRAHSIPDIT